MSKMLIILVVVMVVISVIPTSSYADGHDRVWRHHHEQLWKAHEKEWRNYDHLWAAHRGDRHWREVHIRMWHEWYQWHKDNESYLNIRISPDAHVGPRLEIDFSN